MDKVKQIENHCAVLNNEKRRIEDDSRIKSDDDLVHIQRLRIENDDYRRMKADQDQEMALIQDQISRI